MSYQTTILSNGLRVIHQHNESPVTYCGFAVNAGTRDELPEEKGMAHFVEHMLFKGTQKRRSYHINNRMESVGGELNAYTSKEETLIYSIFPGDELKRAVELLCDLVFNSVYPENELEKEAEIVMDEINSYKDNPAELIFDEFENILFHEDQLGHNILGDEESLESFDSDSCRRFVERLYRPNNMIFFSMGRNKLEDVVKLLEKYISPIALSDAIINRIAPKPMELKENQQIIEMDTNQAHVMIGSRSFNMYDKRRSAIYLLNNILGGPGMNSRLNVSLREKSGIAYTVESNLTPYTDTGVISIYFGTDEKKYKKGISLVMRELNKLKEQPITEAQLNSAKKQLFGQLVVANENKENMALGMGKAFLRYNKYDSMEEIKKRIESVTADEIHQIANEIFDEQNLLTLIIK
ncbi:MAG: M16 family metallopeptidase [Bacteroidales bacterium]